MPHNNWGIFCKNIMSSKTQDKKEKNSVTLRSNWDFGWSWSLLDKVIEKDKIDKPVFIGRYDEKERTKNFIRHRNQGSLFISGENGAGKTSLVCQSLSEISDDEDLLVIPINFLMVEKTVFDNGQIRNTSEEEQTIQVIKQLVRIINSKVKDNSLFKDKEKLEKLVDIVNATSIKSRNSNEDTKQLTVGLETTKMEGLSGAIIVSALLSIIGKITSTYPQFVPYLSGNIPLIASYIFDIVIIALGGIFIRSSRNKKQVQLEQVEKDGVNIHELQEKTTEVLKKIECDLEKKVVIVFDELDKHDLDSQGGIGAKSLLRILKNLKLLFQNSKATFIFLIGDQTFNELKNNLTIATIATDKFFLSSPKLEKMKDYLTQIIQDDDYPDWFVDYVHHKIMESKGNYYNLMSIIRDDLNYNSNGSIIIQSPNYTVQEKVQSYLIQLAIRFIDGGRYSLGEGQKNIILLDQFKKIVENYTASLQNNVEGGFAISPPDHKGESIIKSFVEQIVDRAKSIDSTIASYSYDATKKVFSGFKWKQISSLSNPKVLVEDLHGAIFEEEITFENEYRKLQLSLKNILDNLNITIKDDDSLIEIVKNVSKTVSIPEEPSLEHAKLIEEFRRIINEVAIQHRPPNFRQDISTKGTAAINAFLDIYSNKYFTHLTIPPVINRISTVEASNIEISNRKFLEIANSERVHETAIDFSSFATIVQEIDPKSFLLKFTTTIAEGGILNVVVGTKPWTDDPIQREFLMYRLDSRPGSKDSVLIKNVGSNGWTTITNSTLSETEPNKEIRFWIQGKLGTVSLNKEKWNKIACRKENIKKIYWWGLANEIKKTNTKLELDFAS